MASTTLSQKFYHRPTAELARSLLGTFISTGRGGCRTVGRIVETEAYLFENDPACHAHLGMTKRNAAMFGPPGTCYIYLVYGMYYCFNVVSAPVGVGEAVLIRALEPVEGETVMMRRRKKKDLKELCSGPGKLVLAMGMKSTWNGTSLISGPIKLLPPSTYPRFGSVKEIDVTEAMRIGISKGQELALRFYLKDNEFISRR